MILLKIQPEYQRKFLRITGPPGVEKSISAQLLGKIYGFVYYETDCFRQLQNPYIPLDAENPTYAQDYQKALKGEGLEDRKKICDTANEGTNELLSGKEFDIENG